MSPDDLPLFATAFAETGITMDVIVPLIVIVSVQVDGDQVA